MICLKDLVRSTLSILHLEQEDCESIMTVSKSGFWFSLGSIYSAMMSSIEISAFSAISVSFARRERGDSTGENRQRAVVTGCEDSFSDILIIIIE